MKKASHISLSLSVFVTATFVTADAYATHSWANYHWGRTTNPLPLELGDNVAANWDANLTLAASDWNISDMLDTAVVAGKSNPRTCKPTSGRAEICNAKYGNTGWLGIAQIWISGDHITQGVVKLNDTYFNTTKYNTNAWRNLVTCQEIGHIFGLGHQDENFSNPPLGTCMDYTDPDPTPNQHPNQHDYDMLAEIYTHLDSVNSYILSDGTDGGGKGGGKGGKGKPLDIDWNNPSEWGRRVSEHIYERDLGNGNKVMTDVFWVEGRGNSHNR
ncbi:hypothetical protein COU78_02470 [Candidatus Peregrinibacteria bacterium CG10_big_fil_rev_8_21_14_0_10_49_24]|nr:MAG: hypothetical protein COV83_02450 [Candidatus Peregrinibacteria bacterium CG11_big_fil_rev_8_21_14_0_20_49_14]PIR51002.1 MAG: hypothetical protein COU78_02470 [Candidatus Peregrinibacteria bacterium CG10_big_fil_rev_8_21_14_0_10_49_24]PJA67555.1 MAG: hypothetical protein CO157_03950 [Candidatus Peregrinibacteria bacterium CG_4_9_14_3_um_filter_49_12]